MLKINQLLLSLVTYNLGHSILELHNVLAQTRLTTSKTNVISSIANVGYKLPHELQNGL